MKLNLKEISTGVEKKFKLKKYVPCTHCHGTGAEGDGGAETCPTCNGSGTVIRNQQTILGTMQTRTTCPTCGGEGKIIKNKCKECAGEGIVYGEEVVTVKSRKVLQKVCNSLWAEKEMQASTTVYRVTC